VNWLLVVAHRGLEAAALAFLPGFPNNSGDCFSYNNNVLLSKNGNDLSWSFVSVKKSEYPISCVFTIHV